MTSQNSADPKPGTSPTALNPLEEGSGPSAHGIPKSPKTKPEPKPVLKNPHLQYPDLPLIPIPDPTSPPPRFPKNFPELGDKQGLEPNPAIPRKIMKLPGGRQVMLGTRNNGGFFIVAPNPLNPDGGLSRFDVPGVTNRSSPQEILKAVTKACAQSGEVPYVFDRSGVPILNEGNAPLINPETPTPVVPTTIERPFKIA